VSESAPATSAGAALARSRSCRSGGSTDAPKSSCYKGVSWHKHSQKWYAYIQAGGKMRGLGYFDHQEDAAKAYDAEARKVGPLSGPGHLCSLTSESDLTRYLCS
jgi:hypothetical protein